MYFTIYSSTLDVAYKQKLFNRCAVGVKRV